MPSPINDADPDRFWYELCRQLEGSKEAEAASPNNERHPSRDGDEDTISPNSSYWVDQVLMDTENGVDGGDNEDQGYRPPPPPEIQLINVTLDPSGSNINGDGDETAAAATTNNERRPPEFIPGFRFSPHEPHLITEYLAKRIAGKPLPVDMINEVDLYDFHPSHLVETYKDWGENMWYFFTSRDRKYRNGMRPQRTTPHGYWKATGRDKQIFGNDLLVGQRKALVFYEGNSKDGYKTNWVMHEYITTDASDPPRKPDGTMKLDDVVLCTIQLKRGSLGKRNDEENVKHESGSKSKMPRKVHQDHQGERGSTSVSQQPFQENTMNANEVNSEANYDFHNMANELASPPISDSVGVNSSIYYPDNQGIEYNCYNYLPDELAAPPISDYVGVNSSIYYPDNQGIEYNCYNYLPEHNNQICPPVGYFPRENIMHQQSLGNGLPDNEDNTAAESESMELEDADINDGDQFC